MESRMEKYHDIDIEEFQRSKRNADLYKEVYGKYDDFEDIPIPENTNEIDIENFKSLVGSRVTKKKEYIESQEDFLDEDIVEIPKEDKHYDINVLLEKAKEENAKIKKEVPINKNLPNYLANLESDKNTKEIILKYDGEYDVDLPIVKDVTFTTSKIDISDEDVNSSELSLDILSDLKPNGDTFVSEPIKDEDFNEEDEKEFFEDNKKFSKEDFDDEDDDEDFSEDNDHLFLKILLLIIGLSSISVAAYFIIKEYTNLF